MSLLAPIWLVAAGLIAAGVVVAHLFSTSVPQREVLPTVRFIPEGAPLAVMRTRRITDWLLLVLRLLAVGLLGFALAGAHVPREAPRRVVLLDVSRAVASAAEWRDSARALADGAVIVAFDSIARRIPSDSLATIAPSSARGSLSAALVVAHRALVDVSAKRADAELVIVSPIVREEIDSATARLVALWEGPSRIVPVRVAAAPSPASVDVRFQGDDPIAAVILRRSASPVIPRSVATRNLQFGVRVIRTRPTRADSTWARDSAGALVIWPAEGERGVLASRATPDTSGAVAAGTYVVVSRFYRTQQPRAGRAIAYWTDGEPAATEQSLGRGCVREVAIPVDPVGDVALRQSFRGIAGVLTEPCGGAQDPALSALGSRLSEGLRSSREPRAASRGQPVAAAGRVPFILALFALALLLLEQALRSRRRTA